MRTVYAFHCEIMPKAGQTGEQCLEELADTGSRWVQDAMERGGVTNPPALDWSGQQVEYAPMVHGSAERRKTDNVEVATASWSHPNSRDTSLGFAHEITATRVGQRIHFSYLMRVYSRDARIKPSHFSVRPPHLISKVLSSFDCRAGSERIRPNARTLRAAEIPAFVNNELLSDGRALPVIAISPDKYSEKPLIDVDRLARLVVGLAHVVVLPDRWATFALTNELGKERSCFWGAIRLYWPAIRRDFDVFKQPLYLPAAIHYKRERKVPLEDELFRELRNTATFRLAEHPLVREAQGQLERAAQDEVDALRSLVEAGQATSETLRTFLEKADNELAAVRDRVSALTEEKMSLEEQASQLMDDMDMLRLEMEEKDEEIQALKKSYADYDKWQQKQSRGEDGAGPEQPVEFKRVIDAYKQAEEKFGNQLLFLDTAKKSAEDSPYQNADQVYEAFEAIALVADDWSKGSLGKPIKEAFRELVGGAYRPDISQTTRSMYGAEYTFKYKDASILFERHITLGAGDPECCLSIHMYFDEDDMKVAIGWCGRHLTNTKT